MKKIVIPFAILFALSCSKDNNNTPAPPVYTVPATYNFATADSAKAKTILSMFAQMEAAINRGNTSGTVVSSAVLRDMYSTQNNRFTDTAFNTVVYNLNTSGLQLQSLTTAAARPVILAVLDSIGIASQTGTPASNGVAGVSDRKTLLGANGVYYRQFFTKTLMGVLLAHLITDSFLGDSLNSSIPITAKQHAWDQAFYLWCVPADFPTNRKNVKYWGSYTSQIDSGITKPVTNLTGINSNPTLLAAFLKGRAALENNDLTTAKQQADIIIPLFEKMEAAAALHELNEAKAGLANGAAAVAGFLSESLGFWTGLGFNVHKTISDADYQAVLALFGTNFYTATPTSIDAILNKISSIYGWDAIKSNL